MSRSSSFVSFGLAGILILAGHRTGIGSQEGVAKAGLELTVQPERGLLEWRFQGRKLLAYAFSTNQCKPYVRELYSLRGDNVLRDAPADHLHHHGLMYAIHVNGVNFWEEANQPGHQRHVQLLAHTEGHDARGLPQASFTELIHWVAPGDCTLSDTAPAALLVERRTLTLTVDEAREEVALAWHAEFEVGTRTNFVKLHGTEYNGLGLRLPAAWDRVARPQNSQPTPLPNGGQRDIVPGHWSAVSHAANRCTVQVVLLAPPRSHAGTNLFFVMTEPFTYLSVTQGLDKAPLTCRAGDRFSLDYLLLVNANARTPEKIEERYQSWGGERP